MAGPWGRPQRRIFVSYRRDDAQWFAGRLADSLSHYFGDHRVFRDVEGIAGGADFGAVIHDTLTASDAVIVVIGKHWLDARDGQGQRRLDDAGDWVAQEVGAALARNVPVFPVLVEDTPMPRVDELPPLLRPLLRFNAVSVSDRRWDEDTARLAKIVSLDIPSASQRLLTAANRAISVLLLLAIAQVLTTLVWGLIDSGPAVAGESLPTGIWRTLARLFEENDAGSCLHPPPASGMLLDNAATAAPYIVMVAGSTAMFFLGRHVDAAGRFAYHAAALLGGVGSLLAFLLYYLVCTEFEPVVNFYFGMLLAAAMLACASLSGSRAK